MCVFFSQSSNLMMIGLDRTNMSNVEHSVAKYNNLHTFHIDRNNGIFHGEPLVVSAASAGAARRKRRMRRRQQLASQLSVKLY